MHSVPKQTASPRAADSFLFAGVGVQRNGMVLSVLSMLAQQGIDPWAEVTYLSARPTGEAVVRLAARAAAAAVELPVVRDPSALAAVLIRLLPFQDDGLLFSRLPRPATTRGLGFGVRGRPPKDSRHKGGSKPAEPQDPHFERLVICLWPRSPSS
jgi:hypothetical protein